MSKTIKVIKVIDENTVVINVGMNDKITKNYEFLLYELGEELFDPDTNESLGQLEVIKGTAVPTHIQDKVTTIKSNKYVYASEKKKIITRGNGLASMFAGVEEIIEPGEKTIQQFKDVKIGDLVKVINK
jgi:hypothetical protein